MKSASYSQNPMRAIALVPPLIIFIILIMQSGGNETQSDEPAAVIALPLRVHLIDGFEMEFADVTMDMWVTADDVRSEILPEINRIWSAANIRWYIEGIYHHDVPDFAGREELIETIQNSGRSTNTKVSEISQLRAPEIEFHPVMHNLKLFPFIGRERQGFAYLGGNEATVGIWTNKPTGPNAPPHKFATIEGLPFDRGSIGRTCAHELGHNLTLRHPDPTTQTVFNRLMGGRPPQGYDLTEAEILQARSAAQERLSLIRQWQNEHNPIPLKINESDFNLSDRSIDFSFQSNPKQTYQIEVSETLDSNSWENIAQIIGTENSSTTIVEGLKVGDKAQPQSLFMRISSAGEL